MSALDQLLLPIRYLSINGTAQVQEQGINLIGGGISAVDNPTLNRTDVTISSGGGSSPAGTGVALVLSGAFVGTAEPVPLGSSLYVSGVLLTANGGTGLSASGLAGNVLTSNGTIWQSSAPAPVNLAGGVTSVINDLPVANGGTGLASVGTAGNVLTSDGSVWHSSAPAVTGITQLTGDVTAGAGTGSQVATVAAVHGATVPAAGALTVGNGLYVTGVSALGYSALNLAGGAGYVTGTLPVGNLPSLAGDVTGALNASHVGTLAGPAGAGGTIALGDGTNQLTLKAKTSLQATAPDTVCIASQGYGAAGAAGAGGRWYVYGGQGAAALSGVVTGGAGGSVSLIGGQGGNGYGTGAAAGNGGAVAMFSGSAGSPGSGGANGAAGAFSMGVGAVTALTIGSTGALTLPVYTAGLVHSTSGGLLASLLGTAGQFPVTNAGATDVAFVSMSQDATMTAAGAVTVTQAQAGEFLFGATTGLVTVATGATAPGLTHAIAGSGVTPKSLTLTPQAPNAGSTTLAANTPGSLVLALAVPGATGTAGAEAGLLVTRASAGSVLLGPLNANYHGIWFGASAIAPTTANYAFIGNGSSSVTLNSPTNLYLAIGNNPALSLSIFSISTPSSSWNIGMGTVAFGSGYGAFAQAAAATNPSGQSTCTWMYTDSATSDLCLTTTGYKTPALRIGALGGAGAINIGLPLAGSAMGTTGGILNAPLQLQNTPIAISNGVAFTPSTSAHFQSPVWIITGTLTSGTTTLNLPSLLGIWFLDIAGVTFSGGASLAITNGSATKTVSAQPVGNMFIVIVDQANALRFVSGSS